MSILFHFRICETGSQMRNGLLQKCWILFPYRICEIPSQMRNGPLFQIVKLLIFLLPFGSKYLNDSKHHQFIQHYHTIHTIHTMTPFQHTLSYIIQSNHSSLIQLHTQTLNFIYVQTHFQINSSVTWHVEAPFRKLIINFHKILSVNPY